MIGFTGRRVIEQTIKTKLPVNFQTAEFLMHRGLLDTIVARSKMKEYLFKVLSMFTGAKQQNSLGKQSPQTYPALPAKYTPAETLKIARHPDRPYSLDYIGAILDDGSSFELRGDRHFSNDDAIVTFFGTIDGQKVLIIGEEKGRTFEQKERRHFGMVKPEGFRKALRIAKIAEKFDIPIITLVDTPGAFPGVGAEERGQSEAIAYNLFEFSHIRVPIITIVIGEGGSGGALAIAAANSLALLEHAVFSVISPEGCAAILWEDKSKIELAIKNLKMLSHDLYQQGIADHVIPEPSGGAHANVEIAANTVKQYILNQLACYSQLSTQQIINLRDRRIRNIGR
ncbi:MAG: acetyl-CoA carboxylase carboxyltransferase subunit alpha [Bdellovibrionales bacterium]|nr:acetyl-CoA carboxylase carboxyltransferase subunit alpha [Bdellovibrionales bacterium]